MAEPTRPVEDAVQPDVGAELKPGSDAGSETEEEKSEEERAEVKALAHCQAGAPSTPFLR